MIPKNLIKELCKREGKKVQVSRGNVMEIVSKLFDIILDDSQEDLHAELGEYILSKEKKLKKKK